MDKPHIEITDMSAIKSGADHIYLIKSGWIHVGDNGQEDLYTKQDAFDASNMILSDAVKLQKMIDNWGKQNDKQTR